MNALSIIEASRASNQKLLKPNQECFGGLIVDHAQIDRTIRAQAYRVIGLHLYHLIGQ